MMRFNLDFYPFIWVFLILLCLLLRRFWHNGKTASTAPTPPRRKRDPKPFAGLTNQPQCDLCEQGVVSHRQAPGAPPPRMMLTRGRRRHVDTTGHFCPHAECSYHGWVDWGNVRANGHPNSRRWRQLVCLGCHGYFLETLGTPFHAKQIDPDKLVWAIAALAEGVGIRAVARVFAVDPNTVLNWLVEAAEHLATFSRAFLQDVHVEQVQMDELFALLSAVKDGEVTEAEAIKRLSRSPHWVWVAMDPVCKLILTIDIGERTLAMAQRLVHQMTQVLTPDCAPLFLTDGFRESLTRSLRITASGGNPNADRPKGPSRNRAGCPCPGCSMRRWLSPPGVGALLGSHTAWCSAQVRRSRRSWPSGVGRSIRRL